MNIPQIAWFDPRVVQLFNSPVQMTGFRRLGTDLNLGGPIYTIGSPTQIVSTYDLTIDIEGYSQPAFSGAPDQWWYALFAVASTQDKTARVIYVPYMQVASWNAATSTITCVSKSGTMTANAFIGNELLLCSSLGNYDGRVFNVTANTTNTISLSGSNLSFQAGDYVLIAPGINAAKYYYKYLRTVKFDYTAGSPNYELRNFTFAGDRVFSYYGALPNITSTSFVKLDLSATGSDPSATGIISPIAIGAIGTLHAFSTDVPNGSAYIYISSDSGNHVMAWAGSDRLAVANDGMTAPYECALFRNAQWVYANVNAATTIGQFAITGWIE